MPAPVFLRSTSTSLAIIDSFRSDRFVGGVEKAKLNARKKLGNAQ